MTAETSNFEQWLSSVRNFGTSMANTLYNLRQDPNMSAANVAIIKEMIDAWDAIPQSPPPPPQTHVVGTWRPIADADKSTDRIIEAGDLRITNSEEYWVRDDDGRIYQATWADDGKRAYWWDLEGESPVDPVEFMPHPLADPFNHLFADTAHSSHVVGSALADALAERQRQLEAEGWSPDHDDHYRNDELTRAAICYVLGNPGSWPWAYEWWKPGDRRRNLIKAAALIIAEIERLDRVSATEGSGE